MTPLTAEPRYVFYVLLSWLRMLSLHEVGLFVPSICECNSIVDSYTAVVECSNVGAIINAAQDFVKCV